MIDKNPILGPASKTTRAANSASLPIREPSGDTEAGDGEFNVITFSGEQVVTPQVEQAGYPEQASEANPTNIVGTTVTGPVAKIWSAVPRRQTVLAVLSWPEHAASPDIGSMYWHRFSAAHRRILSSAKWSTKALNIPDLPEASAVKAYRDALADAGIKSKVRIETAQDEAGVYYRMVLIVDESLRRDVNKRVEILKSVGDYLQMRTPQFVGQFAISFSVR